MKNWNKENVIDDIINNYVHLEQSIVKQLYMRHSIHGGTAGGEREDIWREMFELIVPKKFVIEQSVFIIDSTFGEEQKETLKGVSTEIDLAIIDQTYTPYIFRYGRLKFVPIEAVAAVVECKSKANQDMQNWGERINNLKTSGEGIARMAASIIADGKSFFTEQDTFGNARPFSTQTVTRPIKIYCCLDDRSEGNPDNESIESNFDFVIKAHEGKEGKEGKGGNIEIRSLKDRNLFEWYEDLTKPSVKNKYINKYYLEQDYKIERKKGNEETEKISLLTFNFQLNQLLMLINNPLLFPHRSYVKMFNKMSGNDKETNAAKESGVNGED